MNSQKSPTPSAAPLSVRVSPHSYRLSEQGLREVFANPPVWTAELTEHRKVTDGVRIRAHAAVLVPLVMHARPTVLLTLRAAQLSKHSGQIAFPGGKLDSTDANATAAALRETFEEVGLPPSQVEVLGALPVYITGTAYSVTPVVGLIRPGFPLQPNPREVQEVFEVPLDFLMDPEHHKPHSWEWGGMRRQGVAMSYQDGKGERFIWGATAGMLRNLNRMLSA